MAQKRRYDAADTRARVLDAASNAFQRYGYNATSMNEVIAEAGVPAGSVYHQFEGKRHLALCVIRERVAEAVEETWIQPLRRGADPRAILSVFEDTATSIERRRGSTTGCPITNLAVELALADDEFRVAIDRVFSDWGNAVRERLAGRRDARALSTMIVASFSGAMTLAKAAKSAQPLRDCAAVVRALLKAG